MGKMWEITNLHYSVGVPLLWWQRIYKEVDDARKKIRLGHEVTWAEVLIRGGLLEPELLKDIFRVSNDTFRDIQTLCFGGTLSGAELETLYRRLHEWKVMNLQLMYLLDESRKTGGVRQCSAMP
jgi:hypothetical protein